MLDLNKAQEIVIGLVRDLLAEAGTEHEVSSETPLIGGVSALDSMNLVELCVRLEDEAAELDFEFDWTSEAAMSKSRSMFRSVASLAQEFASQSAPESSEPKSSESA